MAKSGHHDPKQWESRGESLSRSCAAYLTLYYKHVKASPEVEIAVLGNSLRTRAVPRQHEHQGSMLTGSVTWQAGSRASQVVRVESDVVAEAVGGDAESQGRPAVHGRSNSPPLRPTRASGKGPNERL